LTSHVYKPDRIAARAIAAPIRPGAARRIRIPLLLRLSFLLFAFTIPIESLNLSLNLGPVSLARVSGLLFFAVSFLYYKSCYSVLPAALWCFFGYLVIFGVTGLFISPDYRSLFVTRMLTFVQLIVFFWIASNLLRDERFSRMVLLTYAFSAVFLSLAVNLSLPGFSQGVLNTREGERFSAIDTNPNNLGMVLAVAAVILTGLSLDKRRRRELLIIPVIALLVMTVQTGSRASILAFVSGVSFYLSPLTTNRRKIVALVLSGSALLGVGYLILSSDTFLLRWSEALNEGDSAGRDRIVASTLEMISERPFLGWGPVETQYELMRRFSGGFVDRPQDAHNLELSVLVESGIVGAIFFLTGIGLCGIAAWRRRDGELGIIPFALLGTLAVGLQFHTFSTSKPMWLVLAVCASAQCSVTSRAKRQPTGGPIQLLTATHHPVGCDN
jgi:O-antigen ligase